MLAFSVAAAIVALCATSAGVAARSPRPLPSGIHGKVTPVTKPLFLTQQRVVMVQMAGDPVTVVDAAKPLSAAQKQQLRDKLRNAQSPVKDRIAGLSGKVLGQYQSAYNGIKVQIAADKVPQLRSLPGVVAVRPMIPIKPANIHGVPLIGAPAVWDGVNGFRGEKIKIGIIDTGIDYTQADFAGPGTIDAWNNAFAQSTADPTLTSVCETPALTPCFGANAPKVKGGTDLVGDDYNADPSSADFQPVPHPDPNPLDCFGHGTHVAGTAAGFGVLSDGSTFNGPYNANTISSHTWNIGPGAAPRADLYAIRVFGCAGSTDVVVDAIEWAVDHNLDVINMSLGSPFGTSDSPDAVAATNAARDGMIVVASAGNEGPNDYMVGSPSTSTGAISVAAEDPTQSFPGASLALSSGGTLQSINANGATFSDGTTLPLKELKNADGTLSLGCNKQDYIDQNVAGTAVITKRGTCARVARAIFGEQAGAAAVIMVNNTTGFPPFEGKITSNPDTGEQFTVTIPFLGLQSSDEAAIVAAANASATVTLTNNSLANPGFLSLATFSSGGPRTGDSALKPDVTAPGVSIASAGMGLGNAPTTMSGTSMAAPHTTGAAALVRQAHPSWGATAFWKAALVNTASQSLVANYSVRQAGTGTIQAQLATKTDVVALGTNSTASLSYGFAELGKNYAQKQAIDLRNFGNSPATFNVSHVLDAGSPHSVSLEASQVTVPAHGKRSFNVELDVPAATAGDSSSFHDVSGLVVFTPAGGGNHGITLRVPYYLVPQALSAVRTSVDVGALKSGSATATVTNGGVVSGNADWYAWGLSDPKDPGVQSADLRAVGAQSFDAGGDQILAFAVSTDHRWSNAAQNEFDILMDVTGDGTDDYDVFSADLGALTTGDNNGETVSAVLNLHTGDLFLEFFADAPMDSSTIVIPVLAADAGVTAANPRFTYHVEAFSLIDNAFDSIDEKATFNAFTPAISNGMFDTVAPGGSATETVDVNRTEWPLSTPRGLMIVSHDNASGPDEAQLIPVNLSPTR